MRPLLLHGFAGDPGVWEGIEGEAIAMPGHRAPVHGSWQANLDALDTRGATLAIGYSFGARVALGLLADGRVEQAILIGVNPGLPDDERAARRAADARWAALLRERGIAAFVDAWEAQPLFATQARVAPARLAERRARRLALDPEGLARCLETMGLAEMPDYRGVVGRATLLAGALDAKFLALGGSRVIAIPDAGHDVLLEQPAALARVLAELTRTGRADDPGSSSGDRSRS